MIRDDDSNPFIMDGDYFRTEYYKVLSKYRALLAEGAATEEMIRGIQKLCGEWYQGVGQSNHAFIIKSIWKACNTALQHEKASGTEGSCLDDVPVSTGQCNEYKASGTDDDGQCCENCGCGPGEHEGVAVQDSGSFIKNELLEKMNAADDGQKHFEEGDYVLASKYEDGDTADHWTVGFFHSMLPKIGGERFMVVDGEGKQFRGNGFRRCEHISTDVGEWLVKHGKEFSDENSDFGYDEDGNKYGRSVWDWRDYAAEQAQKDD